MHLIYKSFADSNPGIDSFHREVQRLQDIETDIESFHDIISLRTLCLNTTPIKDALCGFAVSWKLCYAESLRQMAKSDLETIMKQQQDFRSQLTCEVSSLDQLHNVLKQLQLIADMENKIDKIYLPVELLYAKLKDYKIPLPRTEIMTVNNLRDEWSALSRLADGVRQELMRHKRPVFEQELDKQVKDFVVEVIQFRNSFDSQGPGVPGISASEAVQRLQYFLTKYKEYEAKRSTLDAVQLLFGIIPTPFPELDATDEVYRSSLIIL